MPRAERDLTELYQGINAQSSQTALVWYRGLQEAIRSLRDNPHRCPATRENKDLRNLLYGNRPFVYRVIYRVTEKPKEIDILHIRHGARKELETLDLD